MMPKSMLPFCTLGQRAAKPCLKSSIFVSSLNIALATSLAISISKPTSSPLSSMKPNGGASLVTPTITLPRASTSSSLDLVAPAACAAALLEEAAIASPATPAPPSAAPRKSRRSMVEPPPAGSTAYVSPIPTCPLGASAKRDKARPSERSFGGDRSIAHGQRARLAHVHFPGEPSHRARDGGVEPPDDVLDLRLGDDQRWCEAEVVLRRDRYDAFQGAVVADALGHYRIGGARRLVFDDIEHAVEALTANLADAGMFPLEREQLLLGELPKPVCALVELVAQDDLQLLQGHGRGKRVAGIGAGPGEPAVAPHALGNLRRGNGTADGKPRREALAEGNDIGRDAVVLHRPHLAGARGCKLALVQDQERIPALGHGGEARKPFLGRHDHATGHGNGLHHHCCEVLAGHELQHLLARLQTGDVAGGVGVIDGAAVAVGWQDGVGFCRKHQRAQVLAAVAADTG